MAKDSKDRKKEKREKKEKKERKRREAEELAAVKEKKISKKHKSKSKEADKPEKKPKKKSKKLEQVEEKPHKKPKKKQKKPDESESEEEDPETVTVPSNDSHQLKLPIPPTTNEYDSDSDFDKEDIKHLLESYTKEDLINLIYKTAEKGSKLISAVLESADRDSSKRNIFVRGLGWDTTHETLKSAFEAYGEIEDCSVVMDKDTGRAKGYGFVMFKTRKACREALRHPEKRMFNRTVSCNIAAAKPAGAGKFQREPVVESVKIDLNQKDVVLPGVDVGVGYVHGPDKGQQHQQNMGMYGGQNVPFYGHGYNPMYAAAFMGNQMGPPGVPNFPMFGPGVMNHGPPPNHMGMAGQYGGEGNGVGPGGFDGERAWYLR